MTATAGSPPPTRRQVFRNTLWLVGLLALGALPVGLWVSRRSTWSLLPRRPVDWTMKPLSSAKTLETALPDGRVQLRIEHDVLRGVTTDMLVWWWRNIDGEMELGGKTYSKYLIWHPIDHIQFTVLQRLSDGSVGPGAIFHLVEDLGAQGRHLIDAALRLVSLDETGAAVELQVLGNTALRIEGQFLPRPEGVQLISTMTIGFSGWLRRTGLNPWLIEWRFPAERRNAWLKHSVEEIGNLQFFLPDLYRRSQPG